MSGLQSTVGLITGLPIQDTVDQLISISGIPRDNLQDRNASLKQRQVALNELLASVIAVQISSEALSKPEVFQSFDVTSTNPDLVSTSEVGTPQKTSFTFQPYQRAQNNQVLSQGFASDTDPIGAGSFKLQFGGFANEGIALSELNGGDGIQRGRIRITDRSGASTEIDLRYAVSTDDVLEAINTNTTINVTAAVNGDRFTLTDNTGQTVSNLIVQEVGLGTTATDLGIDGINVAGASATGNDVVSLGANTKLGSLNNGAGVALKKGQADFEISFRDNSATLEIDLENESTIGDVLDTLNAADPTRLQAQISADGNRIELIDLTADSGGTFQVNALYGEAANDLGLTTAAVGDTISGERIQAGLKTSLLSRLTGGQGLGDLGQLDVTNRAGGATSIDLSSAETLDDIIATINGSAAGVTASYNSNRSGLLITDTSGGTGNLILANASDGLETADKLNVVTNAAVSSADSGGLGVQVINANTTLESLNNGRGVDGASFLVTDTNGSVGGVNIAAENLETVGDVLDAINALGIGVQARVNDGGDGIVLIDTVAGTGTLSVEEAGNGTAAADLGIVGSSEIVDFGGTPTQVIDGSYAIEVEIEADDSLDDLIESINALDGGVTASKFFDGSEYRLSLTSDIEGTDGELLIDVGTSSLNFSTISKASDAIILVGDPNAPGAGVLATSSSNTFSGVIPGVDFTLQGTSNSSVTINVDETTEKVKAQINAFVGAYNKVIDKLDEHTSFESNESTDDPNVKTGVLFGTSEVLRVEQTLGNLVSGRFFGAGEIRSLGQVGIDIGDDGKLEFDETKFEALYSSDPESVESFFTTEDTGIFARFNSAVESLSGEDNSVLVNGSQTLQAKIDSNQDRIDRLTELLDLERKRLLTQFYNLEASIQNIQSSTSAIATLQALAAQPSIINSSG